MAEESFKPFDFALDLVKQLITLSTGVVALTITFIKDILGDKDHAIHSYDKHLLFASWALYVLSVVFGILASMAITGNLNRKITGAETKGIYSSNIIIMTSGQILFFLSGLILSIVFVAQSL